jgi:hypothetical protein
MLYMFAYDAVLGIFWPPLVPSCCTPFSFNHATDGRFTAARPSPPVSLVPWVPFPLPLASPLSLARFLPYFPSKYNKFFLYLFQCKFLKS